jgi:hypothetical protein
VCVCLFVCLRGVLSKAGMAIKIISLSSPCLQGIFVRVAMGAGEGRKLLGGCLLVE